MDVTPSLTAIHILAEEFGGGLAKWPPQGQPSLDMPPSLFASQHPIRQQTSWELSTTGLPHT